jgi:hypothetical protein
VTGRSHSVSREVFKRTLWVLLALPVLYVASSGPAMRISTHLSIDGSKKVSSAYHPLAELTFRMGCIVPFMQYLNWWCNDRVLVYQDADDRVQVVAVSYADPVPK